MKMMCTVMAGLSLVISSFSEVLNSELSVCVAGQVTAVETEPVAVFMNVAGMTVFSAGDLLGESGEPQIPWKMLRVVLPSGTDLETVSCTLLAEEYKTLEGEWKVASVPPILTRDEAGNEIEIWPAGKIIVDGRDSAIYSTNALWPGEKVRLVGTGQLRSWCLAEIAVPLVRYNPVTGELQQLIRAEIAVDCSVKKTGLKKRAVGGWTGGERLEKLVVNFADSKEIKTKSTESKTPGGVNGYVIITTQDIRDNSTKLAAFATHKRSMGFVVTVIDEDDIWGTETPVAGDASATKLREWLQDNYGSMDLKYALIVGDPQVDQGYVPMKMYPCGDRDIPTDYFYAELTCDWDKDDDGLIGERGDEDAPNGDEIERYFEVYVGRIPHYDVMTDTDAILQKTIDYETSTDTAWRRKVLITNVPLDEVMHGYDWGEQVKHDLLDPRAISSDRIYRNAYNHNVADHNIVPPPEFPSSDYPATVWSQGQYGLHVWSTHGSSVGASYIIGYNDAPDLDDTHPTTVFQGSCQNARPEVPYNLSYSLLRSGGILTIGATRNSYYYQQTEFSNTPTDCGMSYRYTKGVVDGKSCGEALWGLKEEISSWWTHNWTLFNPYGDPSIVVMPAAPPLVTPSDTFVRQTEYSVGSTASRTYTLKNNTDASLTWTATKTATWFDLSATSGTIKAGRSSTIKITMNAETIHLGVETHEASVTFTDTSNNQIEERGVTLVVGVNDSLRGYWSLDETSGVTATDKSVFVTDGELVGTNFSASVAGKYGHALDLDGASDHVKISGVKLAGDTVTLSAWIKSDATQNNRAGIVFDRSSQASGLNLSSSRELRYHWKGGQYSWSSGLIVPADTWIFVALVIEPTKATIYMDSGAGLQFVEHVASHASVTFGTTYIGWDSSSSSRHFRGAIDEVRLYNYAMSARDVHILTAGGGAENPTPFESEVDVDSSRLSWLPGAAAVTHDIYVGTSYAVVEAATRSSAEYKGNNSGSSFKSNLMDYTVYYWRIDTSTDSVVLPGRVWSFTTGLVYNPMNFVSFNFVRYAGESFSGSELIGPLASDSTYWNSGAGASGSQSGLMNNIGGVTSMDIQWQSANLWSNGDGTSDDEHRLATGYLDDGDLGGGKGVAVTLSNIPYSAYRIYGLFATDGGDRVINYAVNGAWALGGTASTTAAIYANIQDNHAGHGEYWTEIKSGDVQGNYWTVVTTGTVCTVVGEDRASSSRGCLTGLIIEEVLDADSDGIPNDWEIAHGLNLMVDDRTEDPDADTFNNWYEYVTDTDPQNAQSSQTFLFKFDAPSQLSMVRFSTSANRRYTVEYSTDLLKQSWVPLVPAFDGDGSDMSVSDVQDFEERFFRLLIDVPAR